LGQYTNMSSTTPSSVTTSPPECTTNTPTPSTTPFPESFETDLEKRFSTSFVVIKLLLLYRFAIGPGIIVSVFCHVKTDSSQMQERSPSLAGAAPLLSYMPCATYDPPSSTSLIMVRTVLEEALTSLVRPTQRS
jgi:hypothetical protein